MKKSASSLFLLFPVFAFFLLTSTTQASGKDIKTDGNQGLKIALIAAGNEIPGNLFLKQEPEEDTLTREERREIRRQERQERRLQSRLERAERAHIDNPNNADYILLGKDLPRGRTVLDAISGRVPGLTVSGDNVMVHGPSSFYGGMTPMFLVDEIEVGREYANSMSMDDIERIEIFTGPSAAIYGSRVGNAVISIYTKFSVNQVTPEE